MSNENKTKNAAGSYLKGATILAAAGIISRVLGLFYKIPLYRLVGSYGNGIYGNVTNIYNMLLMVSTVGIPVAISKMVSESSAKGDYVGAKDVFRVSLGVLMVLGGCATLFLLFGSGWLIRVAHWPKQSYPALMAIAFAPFIISICSAFRGFFQGQQIMEPTAVSQLGEQIVRVAVGIFLCWYFVRYGYGIGMGVGGAIMGATVGGVYAAAYLFYIYMDFMSRNRLLFRKTTRKKPRSRRTILKRLIIIAIPVTLTSVIVSLFATINSFIYVSRLAKAGIDEVTSTIMFGDFTNVDTLVNVPLVISSNLGVALIPAISESFALKDKEAVKHKIDLAIRIVILVGLPCCLGLSFLSDGIFDLLFPGSEYGPDMLNVFAYATVFMMLSNIFQNILQSIDRFKVPLYSLGFGIIVFFLTDWFTLSNPKINIYGMGIAYMATFIFLTVINYFFVRKYTGVRINWVQTVFKPVAAVAIMGVVTYFSFEGLRPHAGSLIAMLVSIVLSVIVYSFAIVFIGGISEEELAFLPGKKYILRAYHKILGIRRKIFRR